MLISPIENFILLTTIFSIVCFVVAAGVKLLVKYQLCEVRTDTRIRTYTWAILLPPVLAVWIVAAAFLPEWWIPEAFDAAHTTPHQFHLLGDLTARVEPTLAYMLLLFAAGAGLFAAWSNWQSYMRVGRLIGKLNSSAEPAKSHQIAAVEEAASRYGFEVGLVMSNYPFSFLWGFSRSKLIVSTGLLKTLNEEELAGLLEHEAAHHQRRDNLVKLALSFCSYSSLAFLFTRRLLTWRALEVEQFCDEVAASRTKAPLDIASALVKLRRQTSPTPVGVSSFIAEDVSSFHSRVSRLIESVDSDASRYSTAGHRNRVWAGIAFGTVSIGSLLISTYFFPLAFHRAAESLIQLFA